MSNRVIPKIVDGEELWPCALCHTLLPRDHFFGAERRSSYCKPCQKIKASGKRWSCKERTHREETEALYLDTVEKMVERSVQEKRTFPEVMIRAMNAYLATPAEVHP